MEDMTEFQETQNQARLEGKQITFNLTNLTKNFHINKAKFGQFMPRGTRYFDTLKGKYIVQIGNLLLASKDQLKIMTMHREEEIIYDQDISQKKVFLQHFNTYNIEGQIIDVIVLRNSLSKLDSIIIFLERGKLAVLQLDFESKSLETISLHNFENQFLELDQRDNLNSLQIIKKDYSNKFVALTIGNKYFIILISKEILKQDYNQEVKNLQLRLNADFFDSYFGNENNRIFAPSFYVDLKNDFDINHLVDFCFEQQINNSNLIDKSIYILDRKINNVEYIFENRKQIKSVYVSSIQFVKLGWLFYKKMTNPPIKEMINSCFASMNDSIKIVIILFLIKKILKNLPGDCYKIISMPDGIILIFSKFFIINFNFHTKVLIILALQNLLALQSQIIRQMVPYLVQNDEKVVEGIENAYIKVLDYTKISIALGGKQFYMLYLYYKGVQIERMILVKVSLALPQHLSCLASKLYRTDDGQPTNKYFFLVGNNYFDSHLCFLQHVSEIELQRRIRFNPKFAKLTEFEMKKIEKFDNLSSFIDIDGTYGQQYGIIGNDQASHLYIFRRNIQINHLKKIEDDLIDLKNPTYVNNVNSLLWVSYSCNTIVLSAKKVSNMYQLAEVKGIHIETKKRTIQCMQKDFFVYDKPSIKSPLCIQVLEDALRIIDMNSQEFKEICFQDKLLFCDFVFNHLIIKGTQKNYIINISFTEIVSIQTLQYQVIDLESIFECQGDQIMDFSLFDNNVTKSYDARKQTLKINYITIVYLGDVMKIYEIDLVNNLLKTQLVFQSFCISFGLPFLNNQYYENQTPSLRSISDPSIKLYKNQQSMQQTQRNAYIQEVFVHNLDETLVIVMRISDGDIFVYRSILNINIVNNQQSLFPYDFIRVVLDITKFTPQFSQEQNIQSPVFLLNRKSSYYEKLSSDQKIDIQKMDKNEILKEHLSSYKKIVQLLKINDSQNSSFICIFIKNPLCLFNKKNQIYQHNFNTTFTNYTSHCTFNFRPDQECLVITDNNNLRVLELEKSLINFNYHSFMINQKFEQINKKQRPKFLSYIQGQRNSYLLVLFNNDVQDEIQVYSSKTMELKTNYLMPTDQNIFRLKSFQVLKDSKKVALIGCLSMNKDSELFGINCTFSLFLFDDGMEAERSWLDKLEQIQNEIISDFTMLQKGNEEVKFVIIEGDRINLYKFDNKLQLINKEQNNYSERALIGCVKSMRNFNSFACGDIQKGVEIYHFINGERKYIQFKSNDNSDSTIRDVEMFNFANSGRVVVCDEKCNCHIYSMVMTKKLEKIADMHLRSKATKLMMCDDNKLWVTLINGDWLEIKLQLDQENKRLQQNLQSVIFQELPFIGGVDPNEVRNILSYTTRTRAKKGFIETNILDLFMSLSKQLQKIIAKKLGLERMEVIEMIVRIYEKTSNQSI